MIEMSIKVVLTQPAANSYEVLNRLSAFLTIPSIDRLDSLTNGLDERVKVWVGRVDGVQVVA
jgi:hypothetical protein